MNYGDDEFMIDIKKEYDSEEDSTDSEEESTDSEEELTDSEEESSSVFSIDK